MTCSKTHLHAAFIAAIALLPIACTKPTDQSGTQGHSMQGMDVQTMMNQCADMRRQMAQGTHPNTPDMNQMMARCDQRDRSMGNVQGGDSSAPAAAPAATRSR